MNEPQRHRGHRGKTQRRKSIFLSLCSCLCVLWASVVRSSEYTDPLDMIVPTSAPLADPNVVPAQFPPIPTPDSFPPDRPDLLARRLRLLLASPLRLEAYGIAAADRARARYSWDRITRETLASYERCLIPAAADPALGLVTS